MRRFFFTAEKKRKAENEWNEKTVPKKLWSFHLKKKNTEKIKLLKRCASAMTFKLPGNLCEVFGSAVAVWLDQNAAFSLF